MVLLLLNYGADITLCNSKGQSALDFAPDSMRPLLLGMLGNFLLFQTLMLREGGCSLFEQRAPSCINSD